MVAVHYLFRYPLQEMLIAIPSGWRRSSAMFENSVVRYAEEAPVIPSMRMGSRRPVPGSAVRRYHHADGHMIPGLSPTVLYANAPHAPNENGSLLAPRYHPICSRVPAIEGGT